MRRKSPPGRGLRREPPARCEEIIGQVQAGLKIDLYQVAEGRLATKARTCREEEPRLLCIGILLLESIGVSACLSHCAGVSVCLLKYVRSYRYDVLSVIDP